MPHDSYLAIIVPMLSCF